MKGQARGRSWTSFGVGLFALGGCLLVFSMSSEVASASGDLFFGGPYRSAIGAMDFGGKQQNPTLITGDSPTAMAMVVSGDFLYWQSNSTPLYIGRSRLDGSEVRPEFIKSEPGEVDAEGLSVSGGHVYWTETLRTSGGFHTVIDRAELDGSGVENRVRSLSDSIRGPVIVSDNWIYFIIGGDSGFAKVERAPLRRGGHSSMLFSHRQYVGGTLMLSGENLYWLESGDRTYLAKASTDGNRVNTRFRRIPSRGCHARAEVTDSAISGQYLFLACDNGRVDRVRLHGRTKLRQLVTHGELDGGAMVLATAP
jgi:hypothetical protein